MYIKEAIETGKITKKILKDLEEMPIIGGVINFPAIFIYNKNKIVNVPEESSVKMIIEGYYI